MKWLIAVLTAFFQALLPWVAKQSRPTAEDADPDRQAKDKLRAKVRKHWLILAFVLPILLTGSRFITKRLRLTIGLTGRLFLAMFLKSHLQSFGLSRA